MFKGTLRKTACLLTSPAVVLNSKDNISNNIDNNSEGTFVERIKKFFNDEKSDARTPSVPKEAKDFTGWDRLTMMYTRDEFGVMSKELHAVMYCTYTSVFVGAMYGITTTTKKTYHEFLDRNQATQFSNMADARKRLQDKVLVAGMKGAFKYGSRLGLFSGGILCITLSMMVYFDKKSTLFYGVSAGTLGAIHRWRMGPKGMFVGGLIGLLLGLAGGGLTNGLFYVTGQSLDNVLTYQSSQFRKREEVVSDLIKTDKDSKNKYLPLLHQHAAIVEVEELDPPKEIVPNQNNNVK